MQFQFVAMSRVDARAILTWKYLGPYAFYNYEKSAPHLLDAAKWGRTLFAVHDEDNPLAQLVGELTVGFLKPDGAWLSQAEMDAGQLEGCMLWIGFGLRPDLTGHGLGLAFVNACVDFAIHWAGERYSYSGDSIGLGVYQFNQRAIKVYERAGFVKFSECCRVINGQAYGYQRMKRSIGR